MLRQWMSDISKVSLFYYGNKVFIYRTFTEAYSVLEL